MTKDPAVDVPRPASRTALGVATLRAAHQLFDGEPRIFDDPIAGKLLGPALLDSLLARKPDFETPGMRGWRSHVVLRSRYTEDRLADAVARGVRQYIVLGAGYDTFAYRQPAWARDLRILEVDQPASQEAKQAAIDGAGLTRPDNVTFVPVNFETDPLRERMQAAGFDPASPAFVSWLGVMVYITEEASDDVFRFVAALPASSEIVFTFAPRRENIPGGTPGFVSRVQQAVAEMGEPWRTFINPPELIRKLETFGFSEVTVLSPEEAAARYFRGGSHGLPPPRRSSIAAAIV